MPVIQERRRFRGLSVGIIRYEFNESDLTSGLTVMKGMLNEESEDIVWKALQFITGEMFTEGE